MRVQAFEVRCPDPEIRDPVIGVERLLHPPGGVLAEHQVLAIEAGERLFVLALHGRLDRRLEGVLDPVDQVDDGELEGLRAKLDLDVRMAALAVRRRQDALLRAEPAQDRLDVDVARAREILAELFLDELAGQRRRARARARVGGADLHLEFEGLAVERRAELDRVALPARVVAHQRLAADEMVEAQFNHRAIGQVRVRIEEVAQQSAQGRRTDRLRREVAVDVQVEARHVDAANVGAMQVDEGVDARRRAAGAAIGADEADGRLDLAHADPSQLARGRGAGFAGDVRHDADDVFAGRGHGGIRVERHGEA